VALLAEAARSQRAVLVHVSSDYVFDGTAEVHTEEETPSPLGVYGTTKAAGDELVRTVRDHYILRTSWVIGQGRNFVATMASLAERGIDPSVVDDQIGRLTFADDLAAAIDHLLAVRPEPGTYNVTNDGEPVSWARIAAEVFALTGHDAGRVRPVSTAEYIGDAVDVAPRPMRSVLDLARIRATGFTPPEQFAALRRHLGLGPAD
jgi:dTDP-4-dehydrorhamnose 3,5-epimerase